MTRSFLAGVVFLLATIALPASAGNRHHHGNDDYNGYGYRFVYADGNGYDRLRWYFASSPNSAASDRPTADTCPLACRWQQPKIQALLLARGGETVRDDEGRLRPDGPRISRFNPCQRK